MEQNYPDPFSATGRPAFGGNPSTTIRFSVQEPCRVVLAVYDPMGRKLYKVVDAEHQPGDHQALFDATGIPSGLYFYRIQMGDFKAVRKMIILE